MVQRQLCCVRTGRGGRPTHGVGATPVSRRKEGCELEQRLGFVLSGRLFVVTISAGANLPNVNQCARRSRKRAARPIITS